MMFDVADYRPLPCVVEAKDDILVDMAVESHIDDNFGRNFLNTLVLSLGELGIEVAEEYRLTETLVYSDR